MATQRQNGGSRKQVVQKLRDVDTILNSGRDLAALLPAFEVCEEKHRHSRSHHIGIHAEEDAVRLKRLEEENQQLRELVVDLSLDNQMLRCLNGGCG